MPRPRRPLEKAVARSPLFRLPAEIRLILYKQLLVSRRPITISDVRKRRRWPNPSFNYSNCKHQYDLSKPKLATSILFTCRLLYQESSPVLYNCNTIHFETPKSAKDFRWCTDSKRAALIPDISICICMKPYQTEWQKYISGASPSSMALVNDFVHIKRLTIRLRAGIDYWNTTAHLQAIFGRSYRHLEWVRLLEVSTGSDVPMFMPLVDRVNFENDHIQGKDVQVEVVKWKHENLRKWMLATLWWGSISDRSPYKVHPLESSEHEGNLVREISEEFEIVRATGSEDVLRLFQANPT